jgi:hypothetical protein
MLCNLKEAYVGSKEQEPEKLLGLSKFPELQPKICMLAWLEQVEHMPSMRM